MDKLITVKIADIGKVIGGATPSTKKAEYWGDEISWISPKDLTGYKYKRISKGAKSITRKGYQSTSTKLLPKGTVLFSSRAPIGYLAIADNELCTNQGFKSVIPNKDINSDFLYYLLKFHRKNLTDIGSGTTFPEISGKTLSNYIVTIPKSKETRDKIASLLSILDEKIEANNKLNDYLVD